MSATRPDDWVTVAVRDLATFIVRDTPISQILAQACGHADGLTRGWDGSLHTRSSFTLRCLKRTFSVRYGSLLARR